MNPILDTEITAEKSLKLQKQLHKIPEASGCEEKTRELLKKFLQEAIEKAADAERKKDTCCRPNVTINNELADMGKWFYVIHRESGAKETLAFRADMDAVTGPDGIPYHGCGHDGHSSVMAALAAEVLGRRTGKNLVFLFQHGEETGEGAAECLELFDQVKIDRMFAFHNIPGFAAGTILWRKGTFACASRGLTLNFEGRQSHAAYPELGKNPVYALGKLIAVLPVLTAPENFHGMTLLTPVYLNAGAKAFGVAAGKGEISFTLRAWEDRDLKKLEQDLRKAAERLSHDEGLELSWKEQDVFEACVSDSESLEQILEAAKEAGLKTRELEEPMRWSEDFGRFSSRTAACMIGIGSGENTPGLHTPGYVWNPEVTRTALKLFLQLVEAHR